MAKLEQVTAVTMHEKRTMLEAVSGIEQQNTYVVTDLQGQELFVVQEHTDCLERNCFWFCPDFKSWRMDFYNLPPEGFTNQFRFVDSFLHLERNFNCVCCCLCRPTVF